MNKDEKTLVILIPGFPENEADSTCLPMQQQFVRLLNEVYPHLTIIILSFQYPYFKKQYQWFDNTVISHNGRNKGGLMRLLLRQKTGRTLKEIYNSKKIIGLLSFWYGECAWVGNRFANKYGIKHYCWMMGQDARKGNKYPVRANLTANELIALSDFLQEEFEKNYGIKPQHVIPPGIDAKQFIHAETKRDIDILATGSLIPLKQYEIFIKVIAEIKKQMPGIKAALIGNGPEKEKLQDLITKLELQSTVTLTGELSHPEVLQYMQRAKVFLHPSSYEGFGVVLIEALQAGCQAISFCKPMKQDIKQWHIVQSSEEMAYNALAILKNPGTIYKEITVFDMHDTVKKVVGLFED